MYNAVWFMWRSWNFLGCQSGTGRWKARKEYCRKIVPATISFVKKMREP